MVDTGTAKHECVSEDALQHLKAYKYSSVDKSYISNYILRHYWNAFVNVLPLWLAPNMVTLLGFGFILTNIGLCAIFMPDLVGPGPDWLYFSFAFGLWMYSTMDNVDGKQARRTGTSSGLGELFDLLETAAMGLGPTKTGAFTAMVPCLPMFFSTWETYHTHTLYLGYFNGPTEGLIIACSIMIVSGVYGPEVWSTPLHELLPVPDSISVSVREVWVAFLLMGFFTAHLPSCVFNVAKARRAANLPMAPLFLEWVPMIVYSAACSAWLGSPYSSLLKQNHLMLFCLTQSFVFGRLTTKIILAHLTRQPFPYWTMLIWPLVGGAVLSWLPHFGGPHVFANHNVELAYMWAYFILSTVVYVRWAVLVINSICNYLGINCLTIPHAKLEQNAQERAAAQRQNVKAA